MGARGLPPVPVASRWKITKADTSAALLVERLKQLKRREADRTRINIVSPDLCDDALKRLGPSLTPYHGCDIIDLNPGSCLWSSKIHQLLRPRWHALVEPDVKFYKPELDGLISSNPTTCTHISTDPFEKAFWPKFLEQHAQKMISMESPTVDAGINRSLLVIANLGQTSKRSKAFDGPLAPFYLQNFVEAMYGREHIHGKGLVRMLAWMSNDQKGGMLPRTISGRSKLGMVFEGSILPKDIAGQARTNMFFWRFRRHWPIDLESSERVKELFASAEHFDPLERRSLELGPHPISLPNDHKGRKQMQQLKNRDAFFEDLLHHEHEFEQQRLKQYKTNERGKRVTTEEWRRLVHLRARYTVKHREYQMTEAHVNKRIALDDVERTLAKTVPYSPDSKPWLDLEAKIRVWREEPRVFALKQMRDKVYKDIDDWRAFRTPTPILAWDQRKSEPLLVSDDEFFPKYAMSLVDFEPRPELIDPIDTSEKRICLRFIGQLIGAAGAQTAEQLLEILAPGAGSQFAAKVPSLLDATQGGTRFLWDLRVRTIPVKTLIEMAIALDKFPLRPSIADMRSQMMNVDRKHRAQEDFQ